MSALNDMLHRQKDTIKKQQARIEWLETGAKLHEANFAHACDLLSQWLQAGSPPSALSPVVEKQIKRATEETAEFLRRMKK